MVSIQNFLCFDQVFFHFAAGIPWHLKHPVDISTDNRSFGGHRRHHFQFLQLSFGFFTRIFRHFGRFDFAFQRLVLVRRVIHFAQFFLNRFHLLIQIVLALAFLHLFFDTIANAFLNLQQVNFRFHHRHQIFQTLGDIKHFQYRLFVSEFQWHMCRDGVSQTCSIFNAVQRSQHFRRDLFVQLDVAFKLINRSTHQNFLLAFIHGRRFQVLRLGSKMLATVRKCRNTRAL